MGERKIKHNFKAPKHLKRLLLFFSSHLLFIKQRKMKLIQITFINKSPYPLAWSRVQSLKLSCLVHEQR